MILNNHFHILIRCLAWGFVEAESDSYFRFICRDSSSWGDHLFLEKKTDLD